MLNPDIGGVELFGVEKKNYTDESYVLNTDLYICFVTGIDGNYPFSIYKK